MQLHRVVGDVGREQVVGREVAQEVEPEQRNLREDDAFAGDRRAEDAVEGGDAVGGDEQDLVVADGVNVANLTAGDEREVGDGGLKYGVHMGSELRGIPRGGARDKCGAAGRWKSWPEQILSLLFDASFCRLSYT